MNIFLRAKSWQMFLLIIAPMLLPAFIAPLGGGMLIFQISTIVWMAVLVGWLYSVGIASNNYAPEELRKNPVMYKFGFLFAVIYMFAAQFLIFGAFEAGGPPKPPVWFFPAHLLSMFFMFYGLWFTAKQFVTCDRKEKVKFLQYSGPFFLFWFSPIGVWFLQPKINELFASKNA